MAHSLVPLPTATPSPWKKNRALIPASPCNEGSCSNTCLKRELFLCGLVFVGLSSALAVEGANAAAKRRPPPPEEKKDPSITGLRAKVLASIKRKEAMKEQIAKERKRGKPVN